MPDALRVLHGDFEDITRMCIVFLVESSLNFPLVSTHRSAYQHICQVLPSETAESGNHWRQKGKLKKIGHFHMIKIGPISLKTVTCI